MEMRLVLPLCTRVLLLVVNVVTNPWVVICFLILSAILVLQLRLFMNTPIGKYHTGVVRFSLPLFDILNRWMFAEKFCRTMAMFFKYTISKKSVTKQRTELGIRRNLFSPPNSEIRTPNHDGLNGNSIKSWCSPQKRMENAGRRSFSKTPPPGLV